MLFVHFRSSEKFFGVSVCVSNINSSALSLHNIFTGYEFESHKMNGFLPFLTPVFVSIPANQFNHRLIFYLAHWFYFSSNWNMGIGT